MAFKPPPFAMATEYEQAFGSVAARTQMDLDAASRTIREYCGWVIYPSVTQNLVVDGPGTKILMLPTLYMTGVTSCTETWRGIGQTPQTVTVADLEWSANGYIWKPSAQFWTSRARGISITFTHGYEDVPEDLRKMTLDIARRAASSPAHVSRVQVGGRMEMYSRILTDEKEILDAYRRISGPAMGLGAANNWGTWG